MEAVNSGLFGAVAERLAALRAEVARAAVQSGRRADDITIVGVSKLHPPEAVAAAVAAGLRDIGENRVQEAAAKFPEVERLLQRDGVSPPAFRRHMVGRLQSNKAARAAELFDVVQSLESRKVARRLGRRAKELGRTVAAYIEVNTSGEPTKGGVSPEALFELVAEVGEAEGLELKGLMTIGPLTDDEARIRSSFILLRELRDEAAERFPDTVREWGLSMGMSDDFRIAIAAGATIIRIGTAIFGPRPRKCDLGA